jgi:hypothetical protein
VRNKAFAPRFQQGDPIEVGDPVDSAIKSADQSVTSSVVLVNETDLTVEMNPHDDWIITWVLRVTFAAASGITVAVTTPTGATLLMTAELVSDSANVGQGGSTTVSGTGVTLLASAGSAGTVTVVATVQGDEAHPGLVTLQFTQQGSSGTPTTIKAGSSMAAIKTTRGPV